MFFEQQIRILEWFLKDNVTGVMMLTIQLWNHRNRPTFNYIRGFFFRHIHNYTEYNQQWNLCSAFNPFKCTHTRSSGQPMLRPGEQLGVQCLAQGSHLSRGIEGGENAHYSLPPTDNSCRSRDSNLQPRVTSPTLYSVGHDCNIFSNRKRLY